MARQPKARGEQSMQVTIPAEDMDLISPDAPTVWTEVYALLGAAGFPDDFMLDRDQGTAEDREPL